MRVARRTASASAKAPVERGQFDLATGTGAPAPDMAASLVGAAVASARGHVEQGPGRAWLQASPVRPIRPLRRYAARVCVGRTSRRDAVGNHQPAGDVRASTFVLGALIFRGKPVSRQGEFEPTARRSSFRHGASKSAFSNAPVELVRLTTKSPIQHQPDGASHQRQSHHRVERTQPPAACQPPPDPGSEDDPSM